jgi:TRAP-type mannitol/chloroaromatic compound transport system permease large subunit
VTSLNQIFAGMMQYMLIVMLCLVIMYIWPGMTALAARIFVRQLTQQGRS